MILYKEIAVNLTGKWTSTKCIYIDKNRRSRASNLWLLSCITGCDPAHFGVGKATPKLESTKLELLMVF